VERRHRPVEQYCSRRQFLSGSCTHNADTSAGQHFPEADGDGLAEGQTLGYASFTVPAGKLLVIEQVSGLAHMGLNPQFPTVSFRTTANNSLAEHVLASPFPNGPLQYPVFTFGNTAYAEPGSTVELIYMRDGEGGVSTLKVTFSGHYINQ